MYIMFVKKYFIILVILLFSSLAIANPTSVKDEFLNNVDSILKNESTFFVKTLKARNDTLINAESKSYIVNRTPSNIVIKKINGDKLFLYPNEQYEFKDNVVLEVNKDSYLFNDKNLYILVGSDNFNLEEKLKNRASYIVKPLDMGKVLDGIFYRCSVSAECIDECYLILEILPAFDRYWQYQRCLYKCEQNKLRIGHRDHSDCIKQNDKGFWDEKLDPKRFR